MDVAITTLPSLRFATLAHAGGYRHMGRTLALLEQRLGEEGPRLLRAGACRAALYRDDPAWVQERHLRSAAAFTLPEGWPLPRGLIEARTWGGRYARTLCIGDARGLGQAWAQLLREWLPASGRHARRGPGLELHLDDPATTPGSERRVEIYLPVH